VPVVSAAACNFAESFVIGEILKVFGCHSEQAVESLYWGFRRKMLLLNIATYLPYAGVPLQCWEIYAIGEFTICCAQEPQRLMDDRWISESWNIVSRDVFSGERAIRAYEEASNRQFPRQYKDQFIKTVNSVHKAYQFANMIPGIGRTQENITDSIHIGLTRAKQTAKIGAAVGKATFQEIRKKWKKP
jgi:hypothetical protein